MITPSLICGTQEGTRDAGTRAVPRRSRAGNMVLSAMSDTAFAALDPALREERFPKGMVLWDAEESSRVYFPLSGLISIVSGPNEGAAIQVGCVGRESAAGLSRGSQSFTTGLVQVAGIFASLPAARFWSVAAEYPDLQSVARWCSEWLLIQAQRHAACNAMHDAEQRLCRWLLQVADRAGREIFATQEEIAQMLGLRRTTLTLIAHKLQVNGLISYRRGMIVLRDVSQLEPLACDCYRIQSQLAWTAERISSERPGFWQGI
jgi:CRP-like cAMP-binding protein